MCSPDGVVIAQRSSMRITTAWAVVVALLAACDSEEPGDENVEPFVEWRIVLDGQEVSCEQANTELVDVIYDDFLLTTRCALGGMFVPSGTGEVSVRLLARRRYEQGDSSFERFDIPVDLVDVAIEDDTYGSASFELETVHVDWNYTGATCGQIKGWSFYADDQPVYGYRIENYYRDRCHPGDGTTELTVQSGTQTIDAYYLMRQEVEGPPSQTLTRDGDRFAVTFDPAP